MFRKTARRYYRAIILFDFRAENIWPTTRQNEFLLVLVGSSILLTRNIHREKDMWGQFQFRSRLRESVDSKPATSIRSLKLESLEDRSVPSAVSFVRVDTTTQGNWLGAYGRDGESLAGSSTQISLRYGFHPYPYRTRRNFHQCFQIHE